MRLVEHLSFFHTNSYIKSIIQKYECLDSIYHMAQNTLVMYTSIWWYLRVLLVLHRPEVVDIGVNTI